MNTGNNATFLARGVRPVAGNVGSGEIGAFDEEGGCIGAGTIVPGIAAFALWGADSLSPVKNGCRVGEKITFRFWDGMQEYPLEFQGSGGEARYSVNGIVNGSSLSVPENRLITAFDLLEPLPNPFQGAGEAQFRCSGAPGKWSGDHRDRRL